MAFADRFASPSRREFVAIGVGALVVATIPGAVRRRQLVKRTVPAMGTLADIAVVHRDERFAHAAIDAALARIQDIERLMTHFAASSDVGRVNAVHGSDAVQVSPETATVLEAALELAAVTDGAFDPCLGRAIALWDVTHRHEPPPDSERQPLVGRRLYRALDVGVESGRAAVRATDPDVRLDLGGIAKGFGVDRAVATLREWGIAQAVVNVGGDLYALGVSLDGDPWQVGIRSPERPDELLTTIPVSDAAVATSGTYLAYFEHGGRRYHHLLDPVTAAPRACAMQSLTMRADDCMTADALGTALFGMDRDDRERILARRASGAEVVLAV